MRWRGDRGRGRRQLALTGGEALAETVRLAVELKQLAAVGDPVKQRRGEPGVVVEDGGPVGEVEVGGDDEPAPRLFVQDAQPEIGAD